ncbi:MAG: MATE family efflux transporter [Rikenellaceae bacterium]|nr:MATE family efflux transporter [Rikenellaceae bacterium]
MNNIDFTTGNEGRSILRFSIPIISGAFLMQLYNWADTVIVGRYVGKQALAAVGASAPLVFMLVALVIGIGIGTTIIISQAYGVRDYDKIRKASDSLYIFLTIAAIAITALGLAFSRKVMLLIGLPEDILPYAVSYLDIYLLGLVFLFFFNCLSSILRGIGDSRTPLIFLAVSAVLNILLDLLLVAVIPLGIEGAAWATVIAQAIAVTFAIVYTNRHNDIVRFDPRHLVFDRRIFVRSLKLGIPAGVQQMFVAMGTLAIVSIVNSFDTDTVAAFSGASRIETLVAVIPMNLGIALTSFTGQNFGVGDFDRIRRGMYATVRYSLIAGGVVMAGLLLAAEPLMRVFTSEREVVEVGCGYLHVLGLSFWIFSLMMCFMGALRGMGNTVAPMVITLFSLWIIKIPLAYVLSDRFGQIGIWTGTAISWAIGTIFVVVAFNMISKRKRMQRHDKQNNITEKYGNTL